jgi:putative sterol carrier protein
MSFKIDSVQEYFETLHDRFNPDAATKMDAVYQWEFKDGPTWHAIIKHGELEVHEGAHDDPTTILRVKPEHYVKIVNGDMNGQLAVMTGKMKIKGKRMMAAKLQNVFPQV